MKIICTKKNFVHVLQFSGKNIIGCVTFQNCIFLKMGSALRRVQVDITPFSTLVRCILPILVMHSGEFIESIQCNC